LEEWNLKTVGVIFDFLVFWTWLQKWR